MFKKPVCLISNDDGVNSVGIRLLAETVSEFSTVYIVAPDRERSASSQALTISRDLSHKKLSSQPYSNNIYSLDGTPVDCVRYAISHLLPQKPSLVITGINRGGNMGTDIFYSGTVGAAMEGARYGCSALAVSCHGPKIEKQDFQTSAQVIKKIIEKKDALLFVGRVLNINIPAIPYNEIKGIKKCQTANWSLYSSCHNDIKKPTKLEGPIDCQEISEGFVTASALKSDVFDSHMSTSIESSLPIL